MSRPSSVSQLLENIHLRPELVGELEKLHRDVAVMFTDLKGSTSYFEQHGDAAGLALVHGAHQLQREQIERHGGRVIKTIGDGLMATFEAPRPGILSAISIQRQIAQSRSDGTQPPEMGLRIGINFGPAIVRSNDVFGDVVNVASRIQSAAQPDEIAVSKPVFDNLAADSKFHLRHAGRFSLKGKAEDQDIYVVEWQQISAATVVRAVPPTSGWPPKLLHVRPDGSPGTRFDLSEHPCIIGRKSGDLRFPQDAQLAEVHASVRIDKEAMLIEDLSREGVFVSLPSPRLLQHNDTIKFGAQVFRFSQPQIAAAASAAKTVVELAEVVERRPAVLQTIGPSPHAVITLDGAETTFGRIRGMCTFPDDSLMSRLHARIYRRGQDLYLEDLGSSNGTFVRILGAVRVPVPLKLQVGSQLFRITRSLDTEVGLR